MKLGMIGSNTFAVIQRKTLWPVVEEAWCQERAKVCKEAAEAALPLTVGGDCRCDSPGHNAHYGSYTLMDIRPGKAKKILSMELVDLSEVRDL